jgi:hypothetical protein
MAVQPACEPDRTASLDLRGEIGRRLRTVTQQWVLPAPAANPALLEMFRDRDRQPGRDLVPWAGEFAGKYLTHAVQILRLTRNSRLRRHLDGFVRDLARAQADDGYLGPWPKDTRLANVVNYPDGLVFNTWDTWGHYHVMLGLLFWHQETHDQDSLQCAIRIGDLLCRKYLGATSPRLVDTGCTEMNLAPAHGLCLLHRRTGIDRFLHLARQLVDEEFAAKDTQGRSLAGDYLRESLAGKEFWEQPKPRWESLAAIQSLAEMHLITGDPQYRQAFEHLWWSMLKGDRHNTGGFTSGEQARGDPYHLGAIETCCTVAWMALSTDMLRLSGSSIVADELELSLLNAGLGSISPSGRWATYDTPMDGKRVASAHAIVFQAREGSPELNCCSVNGPRALGLIGEWALMRRGRDVILNYYGPCELGTSMDGEPLMLVQETGYPRDSHVRITTGLRRARRFAMLLRIPSWSKSTRVRVNGSVVSGITAGSYCALDREWQPADTLELDFDFRPHYWAQRPTYEPYADWETEWRVFGPQPAAKPGEAGDDALFSRYAGTLPEVLQVSELSLTSRKVISTKGLLNFDIICGHPGNQPGVYYFTTYDSPVDGILPIIFSADLHSSMFVNGIRVLTGEYCGHDGATGLRLRRQELQVKKGRNIIGIKTVTFHAQANRRWTATFGWSHPLARGRTREPAENLTSIYRGPILLTFDPSYNLVGIEEVPVLDARISAWKLLPSAPRRNTPWILLESLAADGRTAVRLCDFASAGAGGTPYRSWLPVRGVEPTPFSPGNPLRSMRPAGDADGGS